jgi:hypothetical protein
MCNIFIIKTLIQWELASSKKIFVADVIVIQRYRVIIATCGAIWIIFGT